MGPDTKKGSKGGKETTPLDTPRDCNICKYHIDIVKRLEAAVKDITCEGRREIMWPHIQKKVSWIVFSLIVGGIVFIGGGIIAYVASAQSDYQVQHGEIHRELNHDLKQMESQITKEIREISEDVKVIKSKLENGR